MTTRLRLLAATVTATVALAGCGSATTTAAAPHDLAGLLAAGAAADAALVYRSPTCGCCHGWEEILADNGYAISSHQTTDLTPIKQAAGIPAGHDSCHTAVIGGYIVEGHVPLQAIDDLLALAPDVDGIVLPGMPAGSPGMNGEKDGPWTVYLFDDGQIVGELGQY